MNQPKGYVKLGDKNKVVNSLNPFMGLNKVQKHLVSMN
jgi:hypothetical protein